MTELLVNHVYLYLSSLAAGAVNSVAGGGTLLTFPALVSVLGSKVLANTTSTVALVPGSVAGAWGYRRELRQERRWAWLLVWPSLAGGLVGALLLVLLGENAFAPLVPWLILTAALLFLLQPTIARLAGIGRPHEAPRRRTVVAVVCFQFLVAVYGGYFGAGIGILMLGALAMMGVGDIHQMNAVKTFLAFCINGVAVAVFAVRGEVAWGPGLLMAVAAVLGGYLGARVARRLNRDLVRWVVVAIGFFLAAYYFYEQWAAA